MKKSDHSILWHNCNHGGVLASEVTVMIVSSLHVTPVMPVTPVIMPVTPVMGNRLSAETVFLSSVRVQRWAGCLRRFVAQSFVVCVYSAIVEKKLRVIYCPKLYTFLTCSQGDVYSGVKES